MRIVFTENDRGNPPGKLADIEIRFEDTDPFFAGLKLIGFGLWTRRTGSGLNVTFPARQYSVNGERRSFALLRPIVDSGAVDNLRDLIVAAWQQRHQQQDPDCNCSDCIDAHSRQQDAAIAASQAIGAALAADPTKTAGAIVLDLVRQKTAPPPPAPPAPVARLIDF